MANLINDPADTIGARIRRLRKNLRPALTQRELARRLGISSPSVNGWEVGQSIPRGENLIALADVLMTTPEYLLGKQESAVKHILKQEDGGGQYSFNQLSSPVIYSRVPLVDEVAAGNWTQAKLHIWPEDQTYQAATVPVSGNAFALRVTGKSMHNPHGTPSIPEGSIVIVDPEYPVRPGAIVIARLVSVDSVHITIKKYTRDGHMHYLEPLNPEYKNMLMTQGVEIVGVVRQVIQDL